MKKLKVRRVNPLIGIVPRWWDFLKAIQRGCTKHKCKCPPLMGVIKIKRNPSRKRYRSIQSILDLLKRQNVFCPLRGRL